MSAAQSKYQRTDTCGGPTTAQSNNFRLTMTSDHDRGHLAVLTHVNSEDTIPAVVAGTVGGTLDITDGHNRIARATIGATGTPVWENASGLPVRADESVYAPYEQWVVGEPGDPHQVRVTWSPPDTSEAALREAPPFGTFDVRALGLERAGQVAQQVDLRFAPGSSSTLGAVSGRVLQPGDGPIDERVQPCDLGLEALSYVRAGGEGLASGLRAAEKLVTS